MSTYTPIASVTLSSAQSSVDFVNIPQTYTDLILVVSAGNASSGPSVQVRFNGDATSSYSWTTLSGGGTSAVPDRASNLTTAILSYFGVPYTTLGQQTQITHFMNYSNTTTNKTFLSRANNTQFGTDAIVGLWRNTAAITNINLYNSNATNFVAGSTFNLYGISTENISTPKATGGNQVYSDGTYWYHVFASSGTFTPTQSLTADYLVVAGGGGGSQGGGGAGGFRTSIGGSALSLTAQAYAVTVGAGGTGSTTTIGANGSDSIFSTITSTGGGGGGTYSNTSSLYNGQNGGSGGGGGFTANGDGTTTSGGTASSGQGNNGGTGRHVTGLWLAGGGGGGASATGGNAVNSGGTGIGGSGGNGTANSITGSSVTYSGGGGGRCQQSPNTAAGGSGGGGTGGNDSTSGANGTASTGGGGGGGSIGVGNGGSGIVVIRYAA